MTFDASASGSPEEPLSAWELYLKCLRTTVDVYRHGTLNRWEAVACLATCIDINMRQAAAAWQEGGEAGPAPTVPTLQLPQPLSAEDRQLLELYAEAVAFWTAGYGKLRLIK